VKSSSTPNAATEDTFATLRQYWSEEQIVEMLAVIAMAGFLSRWNVSMATPLEPEAKEIGERYLAQLGWAAGSHDR
jgi:alkylhydroperoxidase family enzyme